MLVLKKCAKNINIKNAVPKKSHCFKKHKAEKSIFSVRDSPILFLISVALLFSIRFRKKHFLTFLENKGPSILFPSIPFFGYFRLKKFFSLCSNPDFLSFSG